MCFVYFKITNYKITNIPKTILILTISIIVLTIIDTVLIMYINLLTFLPVIYLLYSIVLSYLTRDRFSYSIIAMLLSYIITYIVYGISIILTSVILLMLNLQPEEVEKNPFIFLIMISFSIILLAAFFRIKKFRNGFYFLKNTTTIENINNIVIFISGILLIIFRIFKRNCKRNNSKLFI